MPEPRPFGIRFPNVGPRRLGFVGITGIEYSLQDEFLDTVAAGSVNGTYATDGVNVRTVQDTNSKISVGSGVLGFATGAVVGDSIYYPGQARYAGLAFFTKLLPANTSVKLGFGLDENHTGSILYQVSLDTLGRLFYNSILIGSYTAADLYLCVIARSTGGLLFAKGPGYTNWTLLLTEELFNTTPLYPEFRIQGTTSIINAEFARVSKTPVLFSPLASDSFNRANGAIGTADGGGTVESAPPTAWNQDIGTWEVSSNKAVCSTLAGGIGVATVDISVNNVWVEGELTRAGNEVGVVICFADAANYMIVYHDGSNVKLDKVVGGVTTNVISAVAAYSAGARIKVFKDGTTVGVIYNNANVGTPQTVSDAGIVSNTKHGLYTSNTGNAIDNFSVWARSDNHYNQLDNYTY